MSFCWNQTLSLICGCAPASNMMRTASTSSFKTVKCNGVCPALSKRLSCNCPARICNSNRITSRWSFRHAQWSKVWPLLSVVVLLAPDCISSRTASACPYQAATSNGVMPSCEIKLTSIQKPLVTSFDFTLSFDSRSHLCSIRRRIISVCPCMAAQCSGVRFNWNSIRSAQMPKSLKLKIVTLLSPLRYTHMNDGTGFDAGLKQRLNSLQVIFYHSFVQQLIQFGNRFVAILMRQLQGKHIEFLYSISGSVGSTGYNTMTTSTIVSFPSSYTATSHAGTRRCSVTLTQIVQSHAVSARTAEHCRAYVGSTPGVGSRWWWWKEWWCWG